MLADQSLEASLVPWGITITAPGLQLNYLPRFPYRHVYFLINASFSPCIQWHAIRTRYDSHILRQSLSLLIEYTLRPELLEDRSIYLQCCLSTPEFYNLRHKPWNTLNILAPLPSPSLLPCCCTQWNGEMSSQHISTLHRGKGCFKDFWRGS